MERYQTHVQGLRRGRPWLVAFIVVLASVVFQSTVKAGESGSPSTSSLLYHTFGTDNPVELYLGGHGRVRWEQWNNAAFNPVEDDDFGLFRLYLHADVKWTSMFRVYVEGKSALANGRNLPGGRRTLDEDSLDVQNAFLDIHGELGQEGSWTLRAGRQELLYGKQRLVSPLDWANTRRTFEGVRLLTELSGWKVDLFLTEFVPVDKHDFNERTDTTFYGLYATRTFEPSSVVMDLYSLAKEQTATDRYTWGARVNVKPTNSRFDLDVESALQVGDTGTKDVEAYFLASQLGYSQPFAGAKPRIFLGYDYASGDADPTDGDQETFDQLFPLSHAYHGYVDLLGRRNIQDFSQGISIWNENKTVRLLAAHHIFLRAEAEDSVYNAGGGVLRQAEGSGSKDVGNEIDVVLTWKANSTTTLQAGYGHFEPGDFIEQTGPSSDVDFGYVSAQYTF